MTFRRDPRGPCRAARRHVLMRLLLVTVLGVFAALSVRAVLAATPIDQSQSLPTPLVSAAATARVLNALSTVEMVSLAALDRAAAMPAETGLPDSLSSPFTDEIVFTSHRDAYQSYEGSSTCLGCHEDQARELHGSVHYQWFGPTPDVPDLDGGGKLGGINDFCGFPDVNFIGQLTNLDGETVDGGCATCHVGMGARPEAEATDAQLANMDCLVCHSPTYKRKVEPTDDGYHFVPAPEKMSVPLLDAITDVQLPGDGNCLSCHVNAGGGDNNKRGDIESTHANAPSAHFDVHMAAPELGGAGLGCLDCHVAQDHRIAGRGTDLRATDLDVPVTCTNCHPSAPHDSGRLNEHTARVDCASCHIPTFAKVVSTEMVRDYREAEVVESKRLYEPKMTRQANVTPEYVFDNGTSDFYEFGTPITLGPRDRVVMATPLGSIQDDGAKIIPVKHHVGIQPVDLSSNWLIPVKLGVLFQTGDTDAAIVAGADAMDWPLNDGYDFVTTERFMGIYHEVSPASEALGCDDCHGVNATRLDFNALGYAPKDERNGRPLCLSCHGYEDDQEEWGDRFFYEVHDEHVGGEGDDGDDDDDDDEDDRDDDDRDHDLIAAGVNDESFACTECHAFEGSSTTPPGIPLPASDAYGRIPNGDQSHIDEVEFSFTGRSGDVYIAFDAYDIDTVTEVDVLINGTRVASVPVNAGAFAASPDGEDEALTPDANKAWTGPYTVTLPDALVNDATFNSLIFDNTYNPPKKNPWGVRDVRIVDAPLPPGIPLPASDAYGRIPNGDQSHIDEVEFGFTGQGGDVYIAFEAYDIDTATEVDVIINGARVASVPVNAGAFAASPDGEDEALAPDANKAWTGPYTVTLPDALVNDAAFNSLIFDNTYNPPKKNPWGVRDVRIVDAPLPTGIPLPASDAYGRIPKGDQSHVGEVEFSFDGQSGDVYIAFEAYDIDRADEVDVLINGTRVASVPVNPSVVAASPTGEDKALAPDANKAWTGPYTVTLPDALVNDATSNSLIFDNTYNPPKKNPWGVRHVQVVSSAQGATFPATRQSVFLPLLRD